MLKKSIICIAFIALFNSVVGCSKVVNSTIEEMSQNDIEKLETISSVELHDGTTINFEENLHDVKYDGDNKTLVYMKEDNSQASISIDELNHIKVKIRVGENISSASMKPKNFHKHYQQIIKSYKGKKVTELTTSSGEVITFNRKGAKLDLMNKTVAGTMQNGQFSQTSFDDILWLQTKKMDNLKTGVLTISSLLVVGAIGFVIALSNMEINIMQ